MAVIGPTVMPAITGYHITLCDWLWHNGPSSFLRHCPQSRFTFEPTDWADAERACLKDGANLVSVHNSDDLSFITEMIYTATGRNGQTWIGGSDAEKEGVWLWSDGTKFNFTNWARRQPDNSGSKEHCLDTNFGGPGFWNDDPCAKKLHYICAMDL